MRVESYYDKREQYPMMKDFDSVGNVIDKEKNNELLVAVKIHREVYSELGYHCNEEAPQLLHACVCAMFELVFEMPIIKTVLLTLDMILELLCEKEEVTEDMRRYAAMSLYALKEAFAGYLAERNKAE